jgi:hypothetical protein
MATRKAICLVNGLFEEVNTPTDKLDFAGNSTSDLSEGTNLYYTDARARAAISVTDSGGDGSLSYNNTTGVITYTGPSASEVRAHFSVATGSGLTYNSTSGEFGTNAIPNSQLANDDITIGTTAIALGSSSTTLTGLTSVTSTNLIGSTSVLIGTADAANSILLNSTGIVFEGSTANDFETTLNVVDPTADRALNLPDNSGTLLSTGSSIANANLANSTITIGSTGVALGGTAASITGLSQLQVTGGILYVGDPNTADSIQLLQANGGTIIFEGTTNNLFETFLRVEDPTADRFITLPDATGTVALLTSLSVATGSGLTYNNTTGEFGTNAIPNAQLANSSITIGSTGVALGGSATSITGLTSVTSTTFTASSGFLAPDGTVGTPGIRFSADLNTGIYRIGVDTLGVSTGGTIGLAVDAGQRTLSGLTAARANVFGAVSPQFQVEGIGGDGAVLSSTYNGADSAGAWMILQKTRGTAVGGTTVVQNGDDLGTLFFGGADGTGDTQPAASITGQVNGIPGAANMPGSLVFATTPATTAAPVDRLIINSTGDLTLQGNRELRLNNAGNTAHIALIAAAGSTTNRTITFPDATGTVLLTTSTLPATFLDSNFRVQDDGDNTKQLAFECSGITTGTTRTMTVPDNSGTIATEDFATAIAIALG